MKTFKHFDLPTKHLEYGEHYVPPKARDEEEIARRRSLARGALMARMQDKGVNMASDILRYLSLEDEYSYATDVLAATTINTAWYNHAQGAREVMRRRLHLPDYTNLEEEITDKVLFEKAIEGLAISGMYTNSLANIAEVTGRFPKKTKMRVGMNLGNTALIMSSIDNAEAINEAGSPALRQYITRQTALETLEESRTLFERVGSNPTLAQLTDADSPLSVFWRRTAPNAAYDALEYAVNSAETSLQ